MSQRHVTAEALPASKTPVFDALIAEAKQTKPEDLISAAELDRCRPLTEEDKAFADAYLDVLDRLEEEQGAPVTGDQAHLLQVVLTAGRYLQGEKTLVEWAEYTGIHEEEIRAAAAALQAVGVPATRPAKAQTQNSPAVA